MAPMNIEAAPGLDIDRIERLFRELLRLVVAHYQAGPTSRDRVYEVLNAIAALTAITAAGTGDIPSALGFFEVALNQHIPEAAAHAIELRGDLDA